MQALLFEFNSERNWAQFHSARNLAMCVNVEAAELLELFLWSSDGEQHTVCEANDAAIGREVADVLISLLNFARAAHIDIGEAFVKKLAENAAKYPVEKAKGKADKYTLL